jgi:integral membrane protein (TIGR01906 family)
LVVVFVPVAISLGVVRLLLNPWYVEFEYRTPGFPPDQYGFSMEDRLTYSKVAIEYLVNDAGIEFLGDLRFPEGEQAPEFSCAFMDDCTRMYNERELTHMLDVKIVVQSAMQLWLFSLGFIGLAGLWAWRGGWLADFIKAVRRGGWLTLILIGFILAFVLLAFGVIFVFFHQIFFESGTWLFYYSDTLIRLFPERFWRDTFLMVGGLTGLGGLALVLLLRVKGK